jgi:hypothetical protein
MDHLLLVCVHSRKTWFRVLCYFNLDRLTPQEGLPYFEWWLNIRKRVHQSERKGEKRGTYMFMRELHSTCVAGATYPEEAQRWTRASFVRIGSLGRPRS